MEHQPLQLQHRLLTLGHKITKVLPVHTLDLLLKPVDQLHQQHQIKHLILVQETTRLLLTLLQALTLDLPHNPADH